MFLKITQTIISIYSAETMFMICNVYNFEALIRSNVDYFSERLTKSKIILNNNYIYKYVPLLNGTSQINSKLWIVC